MRKLIIILIAVAACFFILTKLVSQRNSEVAKQEAVNPTFSIEDRRAKFTTAKALLNKPKISYEEWIEIEKGLLAVSENMPEYAEARILFPEVATKVAAIENTKKPKISQINTADSLTKAGKRIKAKHPDWDDDACNAVGSGKIHIGMTKAQVKAAWGRPYDINTTTTAYGSREQWVMSESGGSYVYFEDGICTAVQN